MFSKEESTQIRKEFWTNFGKQYPKKWILYHTKIKGFAFKFQADRKSASVCLDFQHPEEIANELLFDKFISLQKLLQQELPEVIYSSKFELENNIIIKRIFVPYSQKFSIHNKETWTDCYIFFKETMTTFENFFIEYEDFIKSAI